jgi:pimeloyl-ACP methyl ester carboxylesterase
VWATVVTTLRLFVNGVLWRFLKTSLPGFQACVGAFVVVAFNALLAMLVLGIAGTAVAQSGFGFASGIAVALAVAALYGIYRFSRFTEEKWFMGWLMRGYAFTWKQAHSRLPDLEERLDRMADHLLASLRDASFEEVIVVGHSTGTMMAASVVGRAAQRVPEAIADPRLALLTLGECIPILSYQPAARAFRAQMCAAVSALGERWLDFTAPVDRCCAALVDPLDAARAIDGVRCASPKILSPQYAKLFTPERYAALRRNLFEMHFQYVKAGELPGTYDYFAITAGPRTLPARFAEQASVTGWKDLQVLGGPFPALARERA